MSKTNILAETLAEIQELREAIDKNANHALKSTLKEELEEIVKNSLEEVMDDQQESTDDMPGGDLPGDHVADKDMGDNPESHEGGPEGDEVIDLTDKSDDEVIKHFDLMEPADEIEIVQTPEGGVQININPSKGEESEEGGEEETEPNETDNNPMEEVSMQDETIKMEEEPMYEIEIKDEEINEVAKEATAHITNKGGSMPTGEKKLEEPSKESGVIKNAATKHVSTKGGSMPTGEKKLEEPAKVGGVIKNAATKDIHESEMEEETTHEKAEKHEKDVKEKLEELHESLVVMRKKYQEAVAENNKKTKELDSFKNLTEEFKGSESDYKNAIKNLKSQLQEVALFSSNLTYAIKLMTENSTTKDEKLNILKRFDSAKNLNESREIFNSLTEQLGSTKVATSQLVEEKIMESPKASGSSKLNESTAYQNPQLSRILEIIGKI